MSVVVVTVRAWALRHPGLRCRAVLSRPNAFPMALSGSYLLGLLGVVEASRSRPASQNIFLTIVALPRTASVPDATTSNVAQ